MAFFRASALAAFISPSAFASLDEAFLRVFGVAVSALRWVGGRGPSGPKAGPSGIKSGVAPGVGQVSLGKASLGKAGKFCVNSGAAALDGVAAVKTSRVHKATACDLIGKPQMFGCQSFASPEITSGSGNQSTPRRSALSSDASYFMPDSRAPPTRRQAASAPTGLEPANACIQRD